MMSGSTPALFDELLEKLPTEMRLQILKRLSLNDLIEFSKVNHKFHQWSEIPDLWQSLLNQHFPYAGYLYSEEFRYKPYLLYKQYYLQFKTMIDEAYCDTRACDYPDSPRISIAMKHLLSALEGDLTALAQAQTYNARVKRTIYILAAAHGQVNAWKQLTPAEKKQAIKHAFEHAFLPKLVTKIPACWEVLSNTQKRQCLIQASHLDFTDELQVILNKKDTQITYKSLLNAAIAAATSGKLNALLPILQELGNKRTKYFTTRLIEVATTAGHQPIVDHLRPRPMLLTQYPHYTSRSKPAPIVNTPSIRLPLLK